VAEEQCMRHGVIRRGDQLPMTLVHTNQSVDGIVALDMINGRLVALQCKALIIADEGFEGAFSSGIVGLGMDMAFRAGIALRDLEPLSTSQISLPSKSLKRSTMRCNPYWTHETWGNLHHGGRPSSVLLHSELELT
jgi:succinate dehydrogenase/fumarate reductase flavoprotein subunit